MIGSIGSVSSFSESCCLVLDLAFFVDRRDDFSFLWDFDFDFEEPSANEAITNAMVSANNAENFMLCDGPKEERTVPTSFRNAKCKPFSMTENYEVNKKNRSKMFLFLLRKAKLEII